MYSDDDLRRELRRLAQENVASPSPAATFAQLRPAFRRARRRRRAGFGAMALLFVGGTAATARLLPPDGNDTIVSTSPDVVAETNISAPEHEVSTDSDDAIVDPDDVVDDDTGRSEAFPNEADDTTTSTVERSTPASTSQPSVASTGSTNPASSAVPTTTTPMAPPTVTSQTVTTTTTTATTATTTPTTAVPAPTTREIPTRCGSAVVEFRENEVFVVDTRPATGYVVAVHDDGHREIEIKFSSETDEDCEVHVKADGSVEVSESGN